MEKSANTALANLINDNPRALFPEAEGADFPNYYRRRLIRAAVVNDVLELFKAYARNSSTGGVSSSVENQLEQMVAKIESVILSAGADKSG